MSAALENRLLEPDRARFAQHGVRLGTGSLLPSPSVLAIDWPELEHVLPDGGLPRGVVEIASPVIVPALSNKETTKQVVMRGGATTVALMALRAVHRTANAWGAWITPEHLPALYAPAVAHAEVDLDRLLVVRPPLPALARTAVKVASAGAFDLVVVDALSGLEGRLSTNEKGGDGRARVDGSIVVRKLALASEELGTTFLLLTNVHSPPKVPWPVALRLEVERRPEAIAVRATKDRRGRASSQHVVRLAS